MLICVPSFDFIIHDKLADKWAIYSRILFCPLQINGRVCHLLKDKKVNGGDKINRNCHKTNKQKQKKTIPGF